MVEGTLDALAIAAAAAQAGYSTKFAPLCESGVAYSPAQIGTIMALHPRPPIVALDGDTAGADGNTRVAVALAQAGREAAIVSWPEGENPASWLGAHDTAGLVALTRRGCLDATDGQLRPHPAAAAVATDIINRTPGGGLAKLEAVAEATAEMPEQARNRWLGHASGAVASASVQAAVEASTDIQGRVNDVILLVARYGETLPAPGQVRYAVEAALEIERRDLAPAGWAGRQITAAMRDNRAKRDEQTAVVVAAQAAGISVN